MGSMWGDYVDGSGEGDGCGFQGAVVAGGVKSCWAEGGAIGDANMIGSCMLEDALRA